MMNGEEMKERNRLELIRHLLLFPLSPNSLVMVIKLSYFRRYLANLPSLQSILGVQNGPGQRVGNEWTQNDTLEHV